MVVIFQKTKIFPKLPFTLAMLLIQIQVRMKTTKTKQHPLCSKYTLCSDKHQSHNKSCSSRGLLLYLRIFELWLKAAAFSNLLFRYLNTCLFCKAEEEVQGKKVYLHVKPWFRLARLLKTSGWLWTAK